jgi:hypothetical protein
MSHVLQNQKQPERRCDGCGIPASDEHLRRRTLRLEMATRFRPVHIGFLLLFPAPPVSVEQFPYFLGDGSSRREPSAFHAAMLAAAGIPALEAPAAEDALARLQRAGIFMAWAVECPLEELGRTLIPAALAEQYGPEILLRITRSYKPRYILPMGTRLDALTPILRAAGLSSKLLLDAGRPFDTPEALESPGFHALQAAMSQPTAAPLARP